MKIIGGIAKGRHIDFPAKSRERPTTDKIKGSFFNILASVTHKRFLDVFAGSGGIGIEAISRGASYVAFIERDEMLAAIIKKNLLTLKFEGEYNILNMDVTKALSVLQKKRKCFDVIFVDPPYEEGLVNQTLKSFTNKELLAVDGLLVIQHSIREDFCQSAKSRFKIFDERRYGDSVLSFMKYS